MCIRAPPRPPGAGRTPASPHGRRRRPRRTAHAARAKYTIKCGTSDICDNKSAHLGCEAPQLSHLQSGHTSHSSLTSPTVISLSHHTTHKQRAQALAPQSELPPVRAPRRGPAAARERAAHPVLDASRGSPIPNDDVRRLSTCPVSRPSAGAERRPVALGSAGGSDGATDRSLSSFPAPVLAPEPTTGTLSRGDATIAQSPVHVSIPMRARRATCAPMSMFSTRDT